MAQGLLVRISPTEKEALEKAYPLYTWQQRMLLIHQDLEEAGILQNCHYRRNKPHHKEERE